MKKSLSMIVPAAARDNANRLMRALGRDDAPDPGRTFSVELNLSGDRLDAVTHYGAHTWDDDLAAVLESGTLPRGVSWPRFGLTAASAQAALTAIRHRAVAGRTPRANFERKAATEGVKEIRRAVLLAGGR